MLLNTDHIKLVNSFTGIILRYKLDRVKKKNDPTKVS